MCDRSPTSASTLIAAAAIVGLFTAAGCSQNRWVSRYDYSSLHDPFLDSPPALTAADGARPDRRGAGSVRLGDIGANSPGNTPGVIADGTSASGYTPKPLSSAPNPFTSAPASDNVAQASYPETAANPFEEFSQDTAQAHYQNAADGQSDFAVRQTAGIAAGHSLRQPNIAPEEFGFSDGAGEPLGNAVTDHGAFVDKAGGSLWDAPFPGPDQPEPLFEEGAAPASAGDEGFWDPVTGAPDSPSPATDEHTMGRAVLSPVPQGPTSTDGATIPGASPGEAALPDQNNPRHGGASASSHKLDGRFSPEGSWRPSNFVRP